MLLELAVRNLALIDSLQVQFESGFNVLTGETGAGKSILMNALGLVVGEKVALDLIRSGADSASVDALFQIESAGRISETLSEIGIESQESTLIVAREFGTRSRCRVNGRLVTVQMLKDLGQALVDIHGQHEHQSLLRASQHLAFLDLFGGEKIGALREPVKVKYRTLRELEEQIRELNATERDRVQRLDLLQFQMQEIDAARLDPNEENALMEERNRLLNSERLRNTAASLLGLLSDDATGNASLLTALGQCLTAAEETRKIDPSLGEISANVETAYYLLEDASRALRDYVENLEADPQRLEEVESRLHLLHQLKKKYGDDVASILRHRDHVADELERLTHSDERLAELRQQRDQVETELAEQAEQLSRARLEVSKTFRKALLSHLKDVAMEKARFDTQIRQVEDAGGIPLNGRSVRVGEKGIDEVEFLIAPNVGQPLKPLARIASGGELSRVMLALKSTLNQRHEIPTLVFDEIDAGIGGATAAAVGKKLKQLSRYAQVLCVTHLPQIACLADAHFLVEKTTTTGQTAVSIQRLRPEERVEELARMLGGSNPSATARKHARELLETAGTATVDSLIRSAHTAK